MQESVVLTIHQSAQLKEFAHYKRQHRTEVIRRALVYYGVISKDRSKPKRSSTRIKTVFYRIPQDPKVLQIAEIVSKLMKIDMSNIFSNKKHTRYSMPRHAVRYWLRHHYSYTLKECGILVCETDHATAFNSIKKWNNICDTEKTYNKYNQKISDKLLKD